MGSRSSDCAADRSSPTIGDDCTSIRNFVDRRMLEYRDKLRLSSLGVSLFLDDRTCPRSLSTRVSLSHNVSYSVPELVDSLSVLIVMMTSCWYSPCQLLICQRPGQNMHGSSSRSRRILDSHEVGASFHWYFSKANNGTSGGR